MAKRKWTTERKWDKHPREERFEQLLADNGFTVLGIREYQSKTDYLIEKDGIKQEYALWHTNKSSALQNYKCFEMFYNTRVEYENMRKLANL